MLVGAGWGRGRRLGLGGGIQGDVGLGVAQATLAADPFAVPSSVVVAVEGQAVAMQAQGVALGIVPSP